MADANQAGSKAANDAQPEMTQPDSAASDMALRLENFLPHQLNITSSLVSHALSSIYSQQYGIHVPEWRVLVTLGQFGEMTAKAVGDYSHMHKTKVSRAVALLEKKRWVARKVNRADLREGILSLTPAGRAVFDKLAPAALEFVGQLLDTLDAQEKRVFERALIKIRERSQALAKGEVYHR